MPELPEVEVIRRDLDREITGASIRAVTVTGLRSVRRAPDPAAFVAALTGRIITGVRRRAKYLLVDLDDGSVLVVHLRMSGQLLWVTEPDTPMPRHTHVVIATDRGALRFVDPRTFGEMFVSESTGSLPELAHLGLEPLAPTTTPAELGALLGAHRVALKPFLLDQRWIVGIGNIYSDEMLFRAGLRWDRRTDSLSPEEIARLHAAMVAVLNDAIAARGSSLSDGQYVDIYGQPGGFAAGHRVHARADGACPECGRPIERAKVAGRSTYFCGHCQH